MQPALCFQLAFEVVAQLQQKARVLRGVFEHVVGKRAHRPVRALMLLVQPDVEILLEERGEPERFYSQKLRGDPRIKDVGDAPSVILPQKAKIIIGVVEDNLDRPLLEKRAQMRKLSRRQRIEDRALFASRELEEIDAVVKAVKARPFGVERELHARPDAGKKALDGRVVV